MRALSALLATALLSATASGCGDTTKITGSNPSPSTSAASTSPASTGAASTAPAYPSSAPAGDYLKEDGDKNNDDGPHPTNKGEDQQSFFATYDGRASPADTRAVAALVKRYYAASIAGDGARACTLLNTDLAKGLAANQGQPAHGARGTCATAISPLLAQQHQHLAAEDPATMTVIAVYVKGDLGLAVLGFRSAPESMLAVDRENHTWRIDALFDNPVP